MAEKWLRCGSTNTVRHMNEKEAQLLNMLEITTKNMAVAATRCSRDLRHLWANQAYANWIQRPLGEIVDHPILEVLGKDTFEVLLPHFNRVLTGETVRYEQETNFQGIGSRWISAVYSPTFDADGAADGWVAVVLDITNRKIAEAALRDAQEALRTSEERLRLAQQAAGIGAFERNVRTGVVTCTDLEPMYGLQPGTLDGKTTAFFQNLIHPDDRARVMDLVDRALKMGQQTTGEWRVVWPDGSIHWIAGRWQVFMDESGAPSRVFGVNMDVTERKRTEEALRESENKLRLLLDSTAEAIYGVDLEHRCTFCNPACLRALGYECLDEVLGKNMHSLIHHTRADGARYPAEECGVHRVTRTGEGVHAEDEMFWRANGTSFHVEYWSYPQRRAQEVVGAVVAFVDITERKLAEAALSTVTRKLIDAVEQERARIARELHDDISQRLALLTIELELLRETSPDLPPEARSRIGELRNQSAEIATDIQSLSHELHSAKLQYLGIVAAMRGFCQECAEQQKVEIDFKAHDVPSPLSPEISLCLFRVAQEALHNSAKHSGVQHFEVRLWGTSDEIHFTVRDSGMGFDREAAKNSRGLGLISMEERLKVLNGALSIDSQPKRGTTIHARVPFNSSSDSARAAG
jgi:PAS domain S-box-containing protein